MATNNEPNKLQSPGVLCRSASLAGKTADKTGRVLVVKSSASDKDAATSIEKGVRIALFFDGTGNNLDADVGNDEHSNVARLFRAHPENDPGLGVFRYYIPGIGTRFKEVGDTGGETLGLAFGGKGQARLDWAMRKLEERVTQSKGRTVHLALFGFSRGAALARAFARMVAGRCACAPDGVWRFTHKQGRYPIRLYFMGLFDSVASVGAPMGTNNAQSIDLTTGVMNLGQVLQSRHAYGSTLSRILPSPMAAPLVRTRLRAWPTAIWAGRPTSASPRWSRIASTWWRPMRSAIPSRWTASPRALATRRVAARSSIPARTRT